jgi:hypothetical protein
MISIHLAEFYGKLGESDRGGRWLRKYDDDCCMGPVPDGIRMVWQWPRR